MKVLVFGDAMTDVYWKGSVNRLNPEKHSAPLVHVQQELQFPGGAANVAKNLEVWGVDVVLLCGKGQITKNRILDDDGVICRFDIGDELMPVSDFPDEKFDAVIVSDYAKGSVLPVHVKRVREYGCPIFVDTKATPYPWAAASACMFPNALEFTKHAFDYKDSPLTLIKQGSHGAQFFRGGLRGEVFRSYARHVSNVSGAGDTVIASFCLMYCYIKSMNEHKATKGLELDAANFAMEMAAVAVANPYTHAPTVDEAVDMFPNNERTYRMLLEDLNQ
jgi:bifunctional ADP-heptose synthase (sugar kinase/adenylyltransferase)